VKWTRAVQHLRTLAEECARMAGNPIGTLQVVQLWTFGTTPGPQQDVETVNAVVVVDLPADAMPWLASPKGAEHWANMTRMSRNPIVPFWRSAQAPVWNHYIVRPLLLWDATDGLREDAFTALRDGSAVGLAEPDASEFSRRLDDELATSLRALRGQVDAYEERRWNPGKLTPVSDDLWAVSKGYLDVLDALKA
jgi:hypothetical protein